MSDFLKGNPLIVPNYYLGDVPMDTKTKASSVSEVLTVLNKESRYTGLTIYCELESEFYCFKKGIEDTDFIKTGGSTSIIKVANYDSLPTVNQDITTIYLALDTMVEYMWNGSSWSPFKNIADNISFNNNPSGTPIYPTDYKTVQKVLEQNKKEVDSKQNITDNSLTTKNKTIYGAINELNGSISYYILQNSPFGDSNTVLESEIQEWYKTNKSTNEYKSPNVSSPILYYNLPLVTKDTYAVWLGENTWYYGKSDGTSVSCWNDMNPFINNKGGVNLVIGAIALGTSIKDIKADKTYVDNQDNLKQNITDNALVTTSKIIPLAINEVNTAISNHKSDTNNPHSTTKTQVGLGNVDNTSDKNKPISDATQLALDLKADKTYVDSQDLLKIDKTSIVDNFTTTDATKVLSANVGKKLNDNDIVLDTKTTNHINDKNNPHQITKTQVGLGNVDNTSDINKPISTAVQTALNKKPEINDTNAGVSNVFSASKTYGLYDLSNSNTTTAIANLKGGVTTDGDTLKKLRDLIQGIQTLLNSNDVNLDSLQEIVNYIKNNKSLIDGITTTKINYTDIINVLTSVETNKPLSANQGKVLNDLITSLTTVVSNKVTNTLKINGKSLTSDITLTKADFSDLNLVDNTTDINKNVLSATKLTTARTISHTGDVTGSNTFNGTVDVAIPMTLTNTGITTGTYTKVTVDAKGRATSGTTLVATDIPTLTASKISDFDTQVRTSTLNQMAKPTVDLDMNSKKITNIATPTLSTDVVNKSYSDTQDALKQNITDNSLATINKTIPTAINELNTTMANNSICAIYQDNAFSNYGTPNSLVFVPPLAFQSWYDKNKSKNGYLSPDTLNPLDLFPELPVIPKGMTVIWCGENEWVSGGGDGTKSCWKNMTKFNTPKYGCGIVPYMVAMGTTAKEGKGCLGNVDNTADKDKIVSTPQQTALNLKADKVTGKSLIDDTKITKLDGISTGANKVETSINNGNIKIDGVEKNVYRHPDGTNPHGTTKSDVGLGNCDNTSDANKPISTPQQTYIDNNLMKYSDGTWYNKPLDELKKGFWYVEGCTNALGYPSGVTYAWVEVLKGFYRIIDRSTGQKWTRYIKSDGNYSNWTEDVQTKAYVDNGFTAIYNTLDKKVNITDIVDSLTSTEVSKPLSANQGKTIKGLIDGLSTSNHTHTNKALLDTYTQTNGNLADAVSNIHTQNTDYKLTSIGLNVINTTGAGDIVEFKVNSVAKSSIDNNGDFSGKSAYANKLATPRNIALSGDIAGMAYNFDGSKDVSIVSTLPNIITAGTGTKITYNAKGQVTASNPLTATDIPTLTASKISDFDTQVRTSTLNQIAIPTADLNINSKKITNVADPVNTQDASTKNYVDTADNKKQDKTDNSLATNAKTVVGAINEVYGTVKENIPYAIYQTTPWGSTQSISQAQIQAWYDVNKNIDSTVKSPDTESPLTLYPNLPAVPNGLFAVWCGNTTWYYRQGDGTAKTWTSMTTMPSLKGGLSSGIKYIALGSTSNDLKADKTFVNSQVALKTDKTTFDNQIALKTDKTYTDSNLLLKVDKESGKALISSADQNKLNGIAFNATKVSIPSNLLPENNGSIIINDSLSKVYTHPTSHPASMITGITAGMVSGLSTVATSGSYSSLSGVPTTATTSVNGLMSSSDKTKLDGIINTFSGYLYTNGYFVLPLGGTNIIFQWGTASTPSSTATTTFSFPTPFPNGCFNLQATVKWNTSSGSGVDSCYANIVDKNSFTITHDYTGTCLSWDHYWFAIGY